MNAKHTPNNLSVQLQDWALNLFEGPERTIAIYGGRGGGKTIPICINIALFCFKYPGARVVILREFKKSGEDGALLEVFKQASLIAPNKVKRMRAPIGVSFSNGSEVVVLGSERNIDNLRDSLNHADIVFLEESQTLSKDAYDTFRPSVRGRAIHGGPKKIIYSFNPRYKSDVVSQMFIENPSSRSKIVRVNYGDYPELMDEGIDEEIAADIERGNPNFNHIWRGDYVREVGSVFNMSQLQHMTRDEFLKEPGELVWCRAWDFAATEGGGDWTVGVRMLRKGGKFFIDDIQRVQRDPGGVRNKFREMLHVDTGEPEMKNPLYFMEEEGGSSGKIAAGAYTEICSEFGVPGYAVKSTGKKVDRATPFAAAVNNRHVYADKRASWHEDFVLEGVAFSANPKDYKHDDQIDACSLGYNELVKYQPLPADMRPIGLA